MGQYIQTSGDYNIKAGVGANIILDTGPAVGTTYITGNLTVLGATLNIDTQNLNLKDNLLVLNAGEVGPGVTLQYAGIEVQRSQGETTPAASILWNEVDQTWNFVQGTPSTALSYTGSAIKVSKILTNPTTDNGDLTLIGSGTGVVKVTGTSNYQNQVINDNDIPNKRYVDDAIQNNPTFQILKGDTRVITTDKDIAGSITQFTDITGFNTESRSASSIIVDSVLSAQFYTDKIYLQELQISSNTISNQNSNQDINLTTYGTGKVTTNYALELKNIAVTPVAVTGAALLYGATASVGTTGVYFVNSTRSGEIISKNKALVFSMLF